MTEILRFLQKVKFRVLIAKILDRQLSFKITAVPYWVYKNKNLHVQILV